MFLLLREICLILLGRIHLHSIGNGVWTTQKQRNWSHLCELGDWKQTAGLTHGAVTNDKMIIMKYHWKFSLVVIYVSVTPWRFITPHFSPAVSILSLSNARQSYTLKWWCINVFRGSKDKTLPRKNLFSIQKCWF